MNESLDKLHSFQKQPEALRLADSLDREWADYALTYDTALEASAELRRLHEVNQEMLEALKLADLMLSGSNMNHRVVETKVRAAIAKATGGAA